MSKVEFLERPTTVSVLSGSIIVTVVGTNERHAPHADRVVAVPREVLRPMCDHVFHRHFCGDVVLGPRPTFYDRFRGK